MSKTMLYKHPGPHEIHGDHFDYIIVEDEEIEQAKAEGWFLTTPEAKKGKVVKQAPVKTTDKKDKPAAGWGQKPDDVDI